MTRLSFLIVMTSLTSASPLLILKFKLWTFSVGSWQIPCSVQLLTRNVAHLQSGFQAREKRTSLLPGVITFSNILITLSASKLKMYLHLEHTPWQDSKRHNSTRQDTNDNTACDRTAQRRNSRVHDVRRCSQVYVHFAPLSSSLSVAFPCHVPRVLSVEVELRHWYA